MSLLLQNTQKVCMHAQAEPAVYFMFVCMRVQPYGICTLLQLACSVHRQTKTLLHQSKHTHARPPPLCTEAILATPYDGTYLSSVFHAGAKPAAGDDSSANTTLLTCGEENMVIAIMAASDTSVRQSVIDGVVRTLLSR